MALALLVDPDWTDAAARALSSRMPGLKIVTDLSRTNLPEVRYIVTFAPPSGTFSRLPGLELICSAGSGAERLLEAADLPSHVPVVRVVDPATNVGIAQYVIYMLLRHTRRFSEYEAQQRNRIWCRLSVQPPEDLTVGVLGLGCLGQEVARRCAALGFRVVGWSRTPKELEGINCYCGDKGLEECLRQSNVLVCLLPLTPKTRGIVDAPQLQLLPPGAYLVNVARGAHVVGAALLESIESGHISGAALDVHFPEPLPRESYLWSHPAITVTPHIAWRTTASAMADQVCTNIERLQAGQSLLNEVLRERGY